MPAPQLIATDVWCDVFGGGAYTSLKMLEYLIMKAGSSYFDFVKNPKTAISWLTTREIATDDLYGALRPSWCSKTGRCSSFALKVCYILESTYPGVFEFEYFNLSGHRIARCRNTDIVIDSSSPGGALLVREGTWLAPQASDSRWKYKKGTSKFSADGRLRVSTDVISAHSAMCICLQEVAARGTVVTLFRSVDARKPEYHALIRWDFKNHNLHLTSKAKGGKNAVIRWGQGQGREDDVVSVQKFYAFLDKYGGPNWHSQWAADDISSINQLLWKEATRVWGYAVYADVA